MAVLEFVEEARAALAHGVKYVVIGNLGGTLYGSPLVQATRICARRVTNRISWRSPRLSKR